MGHDRRPIRSTLTEPELGQSLTNEDGPACRARDAEIDEGPSSPATMPEQ